MKEKGFTLIELLAVIVILAIIALIATPVILGIINNVKEEANKRSIEMYAKAIENAVAKEQIKDPSKVIIDSFLLKEDNPKKLIGVYETELNLEYDGESVFCQTTEVYKDGGLYLSGCEVGGKEVEYTYGTKQVIPGIFKSVCEISEDSSTQGYQRGTKYNCKVEPNKDPYTFYVLTTPEKGATTINLIMDSNIDSTGKGLSYQEFDEHILSWDSEYDGHYGPVTAMKYLYEATKNWTNVNPLNYEYLNKEIQAVSIYYSYESFIAKDGILKLTSSGTDYKEIGTKEVPLRARMPIYTENETYKQMNEVGEWNIYSEVNKFLFDNLSRSGIPCNGYWTISGKKGSSPLQAWVVSNTEWIGNSSEDVWVFVESADIDYELYKAGVRPVVTFDI